MARIVGHRHAAHAHAVAAFLGLGVMRPALRHIVCMPVQQPALTAVSIAVVRAQAVIAHMAQPGIQLEGQPQRGQVGLAGHTGPIQGDFQRIGIAHPVGHGNVQPGHRRRLEVIGHLQAVFIHHGGFPFLHAVTAHRMPDALAHRVLIAPVIVGIGAEHGQLRRAKQAFLAGQVAEGNHAAGGLIQQ